MDKTMYNFPSRIKGLREKMGMTQSELAKKLNLSRAAVNSWEMGLSAPSTPFIVELAHLFHVATDYLLGMNECLAIRTDGLTEQEIGLLLNMVETFNNAHQESSKDFF